LPLTRAEAGTLIATICAQLVALMGAIWGVHLVAGALQGRQRRPVHRRYRRRAGALAWYATEIVGRAADTIFCTASRGAIRAPSARSPISSRIWIVIRYCVRRAEPSFSRLRGTQS